MPPLDTETSIENKINSLYRIESTTNPHLRRGLKLVQEDSKAAVGDLYPEWLDKVTFLIRYGRRIYFDYSFPIREEEAFKAFLTDLYPDLNQRNLWSKIIGYEVTKFDGEELGFEGLNAFGFRLYSLDPADHPLRESRPTATVHILGSKTQK